MKCYILKDADFEKFRLMLRKDTKHSMLSDEERKEIDVAFRHYNYIIECWISEVKDGK